MNKALLVGYGSIGRKHCVVLTENFNFTVDIVTKQKIDNYLCFKGLSDVNSLDQYDYYLITSPTQLHYEQLVYLNSKLDNKKIFVEKPVYNVPHSLKLKNQVFIGYNLRYAFVMDELKRLIDTDTVLFIQSYVGQYLPTWRKNIDYRSSYSASKKQGGGVLLDLSHELDYIQYLCGSITEINAYNKKISDLEIDSDDMVTAIAKTSKGTIVNVTMDYISKQTMRYCLVHLRDKTIYVDFIRSVLNISDKAGNMYSIRIEKEIENYSYRYMHEEILDDNSVQKKVCTYSEAMTIVDLIARIKGE